MSDEIRYYEGRVKVKKIIKESASNKITLYELLEDGLLGNKKFGFRKGKKGELITAPVRRCFLKRDNFKYNE